jgi:hypothetical protein
MSGAGFDHMQVSRKRLEICLASAEFWVDELPRYADRNQRRADWWAIASGGVAAITGLSIWPVLTAHSSDLAKAVVSGATLVAAMLALVPRIKNYADNAGQARELSSRYGSLRGRLVDITQADDVDQAEVRALLAEFQAAKEKKDSLRGLPDRAKTEARLAKAQRKKAAAQEAQAKAQQAEAEAQRAAAVMQQDATAAQAGALQARAGLADLEVATLGLERLAAQAKADRAEDG